MKKVFALLFSAAMMTGVAVAQEQPAPKAPLEQKTNQVKTVSAEEQDKQPSERLQQKMEQIKNMEGVSIQQGNDEKKPTHGASKTEHMMKGQPATPAQPAQPAQPAHKTEDGVKVPAQPATPATPANDKADEKRGNSKGSKKAK
jgi:hypothetical protein